MQKIVPSKANCLLLALIFLLMLSICSCTPVNNTKKTADPPAKPPTANSLYDYELIYTYHNIAYNKENIQGIAELLQSKNNFEVAKIDYTDDNGILIIEYRLQLSEKEPNYTINFTKKMQDAIVLFAVFDYIKGVEINFTQADYTFGGTQIMRAEAEAVFGKMIAPFGSTRKKFTEEFPNEIQAVVWEPGVMDTVNYYHAMGLDEK